MAAPTITAKDSTNADQIVVTLAAANATKANAPTIGLAAEDAAFLGSLTETAPASDTASAGINGRLQRIAQRLTALLGDFSAGEYETVAASQTAQVIGSTGAVGDYLSGLLVIPTSTSPGAVTVLDNAISIPVFAGGASSVSGLIPFFIPMGMKSVSGAWKVTTGANVSVIAIGNFT